MRRKAWGKWLTGEKKPVETVLIRVPKAFQEEAKALVLRAWQDKHSQKKELAANDQTLEGKCNAHY